MWPTNRAVNVFYWCVAVVEDVLALWKRHANSTLVVPPLRLAWLKSLTTMTRASGCFVSWLLIAGYCLKVIDWKYCDSTFLLQIGYLPQNLVEFLVYWTNDVSGLWHDTFHHIYNADWTTTTEYSDGKIITSPTHDPTHLGLVRFGLTFQQPFGKQPTLSPGWFLCRDQTVSSNNNNMLINEWK